MRKCPACKKTAELVEVWPAMYLCKECWKGKSWCGKKPPKDSTITPNK